MKQGMTLKQKIQELCDEMEAEEAENSYSLICLPETSGKEDEK